MRNRYLPLALLAAFLLAGCNELVQENPNEQTTDTFWENREQAVTGVNAAYNGLQDLGAYGRWLNFAYDLRSDIGFSRSPWTDLSNFMKFTFTSYDFEPNAHLWQHPYGVVFRANQVIARVPEIEMDATERDRIVGEAKFIRALSYFNLVTLYGSVPLILEPSQPEVRPASTPVAEIWAQIEKDLKEAAAVLPATYGEADKGRATKWAAIALLGRTYLQQQKWSEAAAQLGDVVNNGGFDLLANYGDLFNQNGENTKESIFEVQFTDDQRLSTGARGLTFPQMTGPCGPAYCDGNPTQWYFQEFFKEKTTSGQNDPRLNYTIFWNDPNGMDVFGESFADRYADRLNDLFWKKYTEYYKGRSIWDNAINFKVMRLGGILLLYADALNEAGQTAQAVAPVNRVRARVGLSPLASGLTKEQMRAEIEHQILLELGMEHERWFYLVRHNLLTAQYLPTLKAHDPEFNFFEPGKSELLPIPQTEVDLNPNVTQNPGWR